jgi:monoterpene epsilon-lactone hydrolase
VPSEQALRVRTVLVEQVTPSFKGLSNVAAMRQLWEVLAARSTPVSDEVAWEPAAAGKVPCEWVHGPTNRSGKAVLFLHGGCYVFGSAATYRELIGRLSLATGMWVLAPDYRLAPEHPFPAALDDALATYRWLLSTGTKPGSVVIAGDSAGGGLALATLVALRDAGDPLPAAAVLLSPATDLTCSGDSYASRAESDPLFTREQVVTLVANYLASADPASPLASPMYADLAGLPPLLVHVGSDEVLLDDSTRLAERATAAGVNVDLKVWDGMWHEFQRFAGRGVVEAQESIDLIGAFVKKWVG